MELPTGQLDDLQENLLLLVVIPVLIGSTFIAGANYATPDETVRVGYVEVSTYCSGIDVGVCLGRERRAHTTYNYDNWTDPEPGTENFYRKVESELMARAYNVCDQDTDGMDWTTEVTYRNRTAKEWMETGNVQLLPCEQTFWRNMTRG